jgi:PAS domain S-box-containing protein
MPFLTATAVVALSVVLVVTIYFTLLELQWIAFLFGVLFAAVLSMVTQTVKVQWRLMRRDAQLRRNKELLAEEIARTERSAQALKTAELRHRMILDGLPLMIFFVDREERCRHYNAAFQEWCGYGAADIAGLPLKDLFAADAYDTLSSGGREALLGTALEYEARWGCPDGDRHVSVKLMPYPAGAQTPSGYYAFVSRLPAGRARGAAPDPAARIDPEAASETLYFDAMEHELSSEENPREYLLRALEQDQFILLEQRIEPLTPEGAETNAREILLRLQEEREGMLPPGGFFEVAEHHGLMPAIDRWVVRKLLKSCASMKSADRAWRMPLYCVNVSADTLRDRGFANHVRAQLQHWDIPGRRLCFEINHGALAEHETDVGNLMDQLRPLGCRFTVDGFGSHKVSFAPFRNLRFDFLKIDGCIIDQVLLSKSELVKARAIVVACRKMGVKTIAQFVQHEATRVKLSEIGVDYVQGFGIDKPGPLAVIEPVIAGAG